jgi:chromosome segregation ATPase
MNQLPPIPGQDDASWRNYIANSLRDTQQNMLLLQQNLANLTGKVDDIGKSILLLARMEEREKAVQSRLEDGKVKMEALEKRLSEIERRVPGLTEMRNWVLAGILGGVGLMGVAVFNLITK